MSYANTYRRAGCAFALLLLFAGASAQAGPRVFAAGVIFEGSAAASGVDAFLGIPFAAPPVGDLRWAPPKPWQPDSKRREATRMAPACMQGEHMVRWYRELVSDFGGDPESFPRPQFSEDCLYLNIWRPARARGALPVMVWIHGGSNKGGWSYEPNYLGEKLAAQGVVVISIAYRLDLFGFFSHPQLGQSNFGLLDQIAALRWVQENVAEFGGDPQQITVMGESAGANAIEHLLVSPLARGLFARAVHQSGGSALLNTNTQASQQRKGAEFARAALGAGSDGSIAALRALSARQLLDAGASVYAGYDFDPVPDGHSLLRPLRESLRAGELAAVDLLIGTNADEWRMYLDPALDVEQWIAANAPQQRAALLAALADIPDRRVALDRLITAQIFVCPSLALAEGVAASGGRAWVYYFNRQREGEHAARMGVYHGAEIPYLFDTHDSWLPTVAADRRLGAQISAYWRNFAAAGDPNNSALPAWPAYRGAQSEVLQLGDTVGPITHPSAALCPIPGPKVNP